MSQILKRRIHLFYNCIRKGKKERTTEISQNMIEQDIDLGIIRECTGMSLDDLIYFKNEYEEMQKELKEERKYDMVKIWRLYGSEEAETKNAKKTAEKMLKDNVPIEQVQKYTELPLRILNEIAGLSSVQ